jgi:hypothetical protein
MDIVGGTIDVIGSLPDIVVDSRELRLVHPYLLLTKEAFPCAIGYAIILRFVRISGVPAE